MCKTYVCFNPCSYGSFVLTSKSSLLRVSKDCVSILVLMDLSFLLLIQLHIIRRCKKFQSLFLWIFRSYKYGENNVDKGIPMFQSLFLWIFRSYASRNVDLPFLPVRFNPCSYGSSVLTKGLDKIGTKTLGFNPCSYGSSVLTQIISSQSKCQKRCFNPCSYGSSVLTAYMTAETIEKVLRFQSLFL